MEPYFINFNACGHVWLACHLDSMDVESKPFHGKYTHILTLLTSTGSILHRTEYSTGPDDESSLVQRS